MPESTVIWTQVDDFQNLGNGDLVKIETQWGQVFEGEYRGSDTHPAGDIAHIKSGNKTHAVVMLDDYTYFQGLNTADPFESIAVALGQGALEEPAVAVDDESVIWEPLNEWEDLQDAQFLRVEIGGRTYQGEWELLPLDPNSGTTVRIKDAAGPLVLGLTPIPGFVWSRGVLPKPEPEAPASTNLFLDNRNLVWAHSTRNTDTPWRRVGRSRRYSEAEVEEFKPLRELVVKDES